MYALVYMLQQVLFLFFCNKQCLTEWNIQQGFDLSLNSFPRQSHLGSLLVRPPERSSSSSSSSGLRLPGGAASAAVQTQRELGQQHQTHVPLSTHYINFISSFVNRTIFHEAHWTFCKRQKTFSSRNRAFSGVIYILHGTYIESPNMSWCLLYVTDLEDI